MMNLDEIKSPVSDELKIFEKKFRNSMKSNVALLDRVMYYIVQRKGKQVRPIFVMLTARLFGEINESTYTAASLIELLHTATLVHDDVVDDAYERRGIFSVNALWKNKIAVLVGDYLLAKGLLVSLENNEHRLLQITSNAVKAMSEGELLQIEKARKLDIQENIYYDIIRKKTASLIAAACSAGCASVSSDEKLIDKMHQFGEKIGIAFQIKDDLLDYGDEDIGKPRGIDIKDRKMTLPLIYTLLNCNKSEKRELINIVKNENANKKRVKYLMQKVIDKGGITYAVKKMHDYKNEALQILNTLDKSESSQALEKLINFTIERRS